MELKIEKNSEVKPPQRYEFISSGTTAIACASGGALLGTKIAGPMGGIIGAIASGMVGFYISGSHSVPPHDK